MDIMPKSFSICAGIEGHTLIKTIDTVLQTTPIQV